MNDNNIKCKGWDISENNRKTEKERRKRKKNGK